MNCPICGYKYVCQCKACNDRTPPAEDRTLPRWIRLENDMEACPVCGLAMHLDWWQDVEWEQFKATNKVASSKAKKEN